MIEFLKYFISYTVIFNLLGLLSLYGIVVALCLKMRMPITSPSKFIQVSHDSNILYVMVILCVIVSIFIATMYKLNFK